MADNTYCNVDNRIFYLSDEVNNTSIGKLSFNLLCLIEKDDKEENTKKDYTREPIKIYINSYGGDVYEMWGLIDIIENSKTPIYTYCNGYAMSAAFKIFLSGHKRFMTTHATFMYHQMSCWRHGKYQDLVEDREEMDSLNKNNEEYILAHTKLTEEDIIEIKEKKKDFYIHSDKAIQLGIVDEII